MFFPLVVKYFRSQQTTLIAALVLITFRVPLEKLATKYIATPFLSHIKADYWPLFTILLLIILWQTLQRIRRSYVFSAKLRLVSTLAFAGVMYYRIAQKPWNFTPLGNSSLTIVDLFLVLACIPSLVWLIQKIVRSKSQAVAAKAAGFIVEKHLGKGAEDMLNRKAYAAHLAQKILHTQSPDGSYAVGITSEWGSGKTFFMDLIKEELKRSSNQKFIQIDYNPWLNHESKTITTDFFATLASTLGNYHSQASSSIRKYAEILTEFNVSGFNDLLKPLLKLTQAPKSLSGEFTQINALIQSIGQKIVVFIDDLDRLQKEEIVQVLKLIRNSANFGNTIFVVAYDKQYMIKAIGSVSDHKPEVYLEKIFQTEISLPIYERSRLDESLQELLSEIVIPEDQKALRELFEAGSPFGFYGNTQPLIQSLRDVNRFVNSFSITYFHVKGTVWVKDLFYMELLRYKFQDVYEQCTKNPMHFFTDDGGFYRLINNDDMHQILTTGNNVIKRNEHEATVIRLLLLVVFGKHPETEREAQIYAANKVHFAKYSHARLLDEA